VTLADLPEAELTAWLRGQKFRAITTHTLHTTTALKAELKRVREQGYSIVARELELGLCSIAVPIHAADGRVVAALNVGMPYADDAPARAVKLILPALQDAQRSIEYAIQHGSWQPHMALTRAYA
jgi:IclR family pca regulon transcriptional regulator